ncbi:hypothetical protein ACOMHN_053853 [Nucella lapillus]
MATADGQQDTCPLCDTVYLQYLHPKILPCNHTFCLSCIAEIYYPSRFSGEFACPMCDTLTFVPPDGAEFMDPDYRMIKLLRERYKTCEAHARKVKFYCMKCREDICEKCKAKEHNQHKTDLLLTGCFRGFLQTERKLLSRELSYTRETLRNLKEAQEDLQKKREALEKDIRNRCDILMAAAERVKAEEADSLETVRQAARKRLGTQGAKPSQDEGQPQRPVVHRPVLQCGADITVLLQFTKNYMGSVNHVKMDMQPKIKLTERFQVGDGCGDDQVLALCHVDCSEPFVCVSFGRGDDVRFRAFTEAGEHVPDVDDDENPECLKYCALTQDMCPRLTAAPGRFITYCKSPFTENYCLDNHLKGQADVNIVEGTALDPHVTTQFTIQVGPHRAFDVDDTEQYFVVVEEAKEFACWRSVRLYRRLLKDSVSTYNPPVEIHQPSDVCFYTLGNEKMLLVADEFNDAIHMVTIHQNSLRFQGYLYGCSSLLRPTALTVDVNRRLWVGCSKGTIVTMEEWKKQGNVL